MTIPTENGRNTEKQFPPPADIGKRFDCAGLAFCHIYLIAQIDWSSLSLADPPKVNGHVECSYDASTGIWSSPELIASPYIQVHGLAPGLNYGQQVYEGLKAFRTAENTLHIFRPEAHAARMRHSANMVCLPKVSDELFLECMRLAVAGNAEFVPPADSAGFLYLRPVLFGSGAQIALAPSNKTVLAVYVIPGGAYHGTDALDALIMEDFDRSAPRGTGSGKLGGNYAPAWPHQARARQRGFGLTLHLDSETRSQIEEFSTSGFVGVEGASKTIYVPDTQNAIRSITSESLTSVAKQDGWTVQHCAVITPNIRSLLASNIISFRFLLTPLADFPKSSRSVQRLLLFQSARFYVILRANDSSLEVQCKVKR